MHIISQRALREFWEEHPEAESPLRAWWTLMKRSAFRTPHEVAQSFAGAVDFVGGGRAVFNIGGNKYRLIADFRYHRQRVYVVGVLAHRDYDRIDVNEL